MTPALLWFLVGIGFFVAEMATPGLVLLFFGIGAWAAACAALLSSAVNIQAAVFIVVSLLTLIVLRSKVRGIFSGRDRNPDVDTSTGAAHPLVGRRGIVSRALVLGKVGEINIGGSFWRAQSDVALEEGRSVTVQGALPSDGLVLLVTPDTE